MFLQLQGPCPSPWLSALLFAREDLWPLAARVALDHAAPVELAVALPDARVMVSVVAAAAAHHAAAVAARRRAVAQAAPCARAPRGCVLFTVVGWALQVHQVSVGGFLEAPSLFDPQEGGLAEARGAHRLHLDSVGVALLKEVADLSEFGQCDPAGLGGAGAGDAVAFALQLHSFLQYLKPRRSKSTLLLSFSKMYRYLCNIECLCFFLMYFCFYPSHLHLSLCTSDSLHWKQYSYYVFKGV